jgi:hypothetical protein
MIQENGPWEVQEWNHGRIVLQSDDFMHDAALEITGDFTNIEEKREYAKEIASRLNLTNPIPAGVKNDPRI